jgi:hypothetical protein
MIEDVIVRPGEVGEGRFGGRGEGDREGREVGSEGGEDEVLGVDGGDLGKRSVG